MAGLRREQPSAEVDRRASRREVDGISTPVGIVPSVADIDLTDLDVAEGTSPKRWRSIPTSGAANCRKSRWLDFIGERLPPACRTSSGAQERLADAD